MKFPPTELTAHAHALQADHQVIELPASQEAYESGLGAATRQNLHKYRNRLQRSHPDFNLRTFECQQITLALVEQVFDWNEQRIREKGERWLYANQPEAPYKLWRLLQSHGLALCGYVGDECVAGWLLLLVGSYCVARTAGYVPSYTDVHLGFLMTSFCVSEGIRRGCSRLQLGWGTTTYQTAPRRSAQYRLSRLDLPFCA